MPQTITISLEVAAADPNKTTIGIVEEVDKAQGELEGYMKTFTVLEGFTVTRRGTYPIGAGEGAVLHFVLTIGGAMVVGAAEKLGGELYTWLKQRIHGARIEVKKIEVGDTSKTQSK